MTTDNFCFYMQNRLIQTSQTGGQRYNDTSPFSIPWVHTHTHTHTHTHPLTHTHKYIYIYIYIYVIYMYIYNCVSIYIVIIFPGWGANQGHFGYFHFFYFTLPLSCSSSPCIEKLGSSVYSLLHTHYYCALPRKKPWF